MELLTAVFSYNRGRLLWNCVRSVELFSPPTHVVVFDDRSDDEETLEILDALRSRGHEVITTLDVSRTPHGNLYANMRDALELTRARGYGFLHLMQDDLQFVWEHDHLVSDIESIVDSAPDAGQVLVHFWKRLSIDASCVDEGVAAYRAAFADVGIVPVERLADRGLAFEDSEHGTRLRASSLGLAAYAVLNPVVARVPWPKHARQRSMRGRDRFGQFELLVKPLDKLEIDRLVSRDVSRRPYGDDYCVPWGWRCWKPYSYGPSYASWFRSLIAVALRRRSVKGLTPRRVGVV
jgi:hypothetical protein